MVVDTMRLMLQAIQPKKSSRKKLNHRLRTLAEIDKELAYGIDNVESVDKISDKDLKDTPDKANSKSNSKRKLIHLRYENKVGQYSTDYGRRLEKNKKLKMCEESEVTPRSHNLEADLLVKNASIDSGHNSNAVNSKNISDSLVYPVENQTTDLTSLSQAMQRKRFVIALYDNKVVFVLLLSICICVSQEASIILLKFRSRSQMNFPF